MDATKQFEAWLEGQGQRLLDHPTRVDELEAAIPAALPAGVS
ncbi:hypothetical protein ES703_63688 [subsurface metagenome]